MEENGKIYTFDELLDFYKKSFLEHWEGEKYKWQAIKTFHDNWNIEADDFKEMLKNSISKTASLLQGQYYYPKDMILNFASENAEKTRSMIKMTMQSVFIYG